MFKLTIDENTVEFVGIRRLLMNKEQRPVNKEQRPVLGAG